MSRRIALVAALLLALTLVLAACGGGGAADEPAGEVVEEPADAPEPTPEPAPEPTDEPAPEPLQVVYELDNEFLYKPEAQIEASVGQPVEFILQNASTVFEHNMVWEDNEDEVFVLSPPEGEASATRTFDAAGTYGYYCSIPGHREAGMVGEVIVTD